jgi:predicted ArsR family transcriptional regulator
MGQFTSPQEALHWSHTMQQARIECRILDALHEGHELTTVIAKETGLHNETVRRKLNELVEDGMVVITSSRPWGPSVQHRYALAPVEEVA